MTEKQKKALKILNELWYVSHNDGLAKLRDEVAQIYNARIWLGLNPSNKGWRGEYE